MKILVTGGAGFIGGNYILNHMKKYPDDKIICVDKLTYAGNIKTLDPVTDSPNFEFHRIDICDRKQIMYLFRDTQPDAVINFAAESHVDNSIKNPDIFLQTNIIGTGVLLDACREHGTRFHQVSTDEVYGDLPFDRPDLKFTEESQLDPHSPYSASKASADMLVLSYHRTYKLPVTISRCSNNYGPYQFPEKLIPLAITNLKRGLNVPVYGNGLNVRDWLYVVDHCNAIDLILEKGQIGQIYNIGGNNEKQNIAIVELILDYLNKDDSYIEYVEDRKGHDLRYAIDATKIGKMLGWYPEVDFNIGMMETIRWYSNNEEWWRPLLAKGGK